ncbi:MAG: radical SAM family heme chaperone HemW [Opitutales bacterium]|nr:radical SAM family heme chaperone HemW [Opitutales bacterium]
MGKAVEQGKAADTTGLGLGLYLHVPFCARVCDFCNFYQERPEGDDFSRYIDGVARELALRPLPRRVDTVFWGGGTPGLLTARDLDTLGSCVRSALPAMPAEWTVEMAPASVRADKLRVLKELGVNRISIGVQSFDEATLVRLGRPHTRNQVDRAVALVEAAGFDNWSMDLMFALPGQGLEAWRADLGEAIRRGPAHFSTYCLTFEEDTALWVRMRRGEVEQRGEADEAVFYEMAWDALGDGGYDQYEVSNFARPGYACAHNLGTWRMQEWLGFGPSASSQAAGMRRTNVHDTEAWLAGVRAGEPRFAESTVLSDGILAQDAVIFGLRMNEGICVPRFRKRYPMAAWAEAEQLFSELAEEGLAMAEGGTIRLTRAGRLLADRIGLAVLERM